MSGIADTTRESRMATLHTSAESLHLINIHGRAHIVIALTDNGKLHLQAFRQGQFNASYVNQKDSVLNEIPKLLAELRYELAADDAQASKEGS